MEALLESLGELPTLAELYPEARFLAGSSCCY